MKKIFILLVATLSFLASATAGTMFKSDVEASYYADKFHGKQTANGEIFNMYGFTAAHKDLPFNTLLKVTNLANGKSVTVRVNDRGPFVAGREIDISRAAAEKIDMLSTGTARVSLEIVSADEPQTGNSISPTISSPSVVNATTSNDANKNLRYDIQLGAFTSEGNAKVLAQKLLKEGFTNVVYQKTEKSIRVVIRDVPKAELESLQNQLTCKGFKDQFIRERKQ